MIAASARAGSGRKAVGTDAWWLEKEPRDEDGRTREDWHRILRDLRRERRRDWFLGLWTLLATDDAEIDDPVLRRWRKLQCIAAMLLGRSGILQIESGPEAHWHFVCLGFFDVSGHEQYGLEFHAVRFHPTQFRYEITWEAI